MTNKELQRLVENISLDFFGKSFDHVAVFNPRLQTTGGRYHLSDHHIDFNHKILDYFGIEEFIGVIKHELCHYHLHLAGLGYKHQDRDFKELLKRVGGSRYVKNVKEASGQSQSFWQYRCIGCGQEWTSTKRLRLKGKVCSRCRSTITVRKITNDRQSHTEN